jgi:hypothetical protein
VAAGADEALYHGPLDALQEAKQWKARGKPGRPRKNRKREVNGQRCGHGPHEQTALAEPRGHPVARERAEHVRQAERAGQEEVLSLAQREHLVRVEVHAALEQHRRQALDEREKQNGSRGREAAKVG